VDDHAGNGNHSSKHPVCFHQVSFPKGFANPAGRDDAAFQDDRLHHVHGKTEPRAQFLQGWNIPAAVAPQRKIGTHNQPFHLHGIHQPPDEGFGGFRSQAGSERQRDHLIHAKHSQQNSPFFRVCEDDGIGASFQDGSRVWVKGDNNRRQSSRECPVRQVADQLLVPGMDAIKNANADPCALQVH